MSDEIGGSTVPGSTNKLPAFFHLQNVRRCQKSSSWQWFQWALDLIQKEGPAVGVPLRVLEANEKHQLRLRLIWLTYANVCECHIHPSLSKTWLSEQPISVRIRVLRFRSSPSQKSSKIVQFKQHQFSVRTHWNGLSTRSCQLGQNLPVRRDKNLVCTGP